MQKIIILLQIFLVSNLLVGCSIWHDNYYYGGDYGPIWPFENGSNGFFYGKNKLHQNEGVGLTSFHVEHSR